MKTQMNERIERYPRILTPLGLLYPFQNGKGMIYPFGVGYCPMLADRSFHNLYSGLKAIVPRQFIKTLITNATSGNKLEEIGLWLEN